MISTLAISTSARNANGAPDGGRRERRLAEILEHATGVFCEKGYAAASMRDLSRATEISLAGLYHYFESKEKLLYLIQKHTFETILDRLEHSLQGVDDPEQRVRRFIHNHLEYFVANQSAMKVLSHEDEVLRGELGDEIRTIKRRYYQKCVALVDDLRRERGGVTVPTRVAVLSLFGMMNWLYTWHSSKLDADLSALSRHMGDLFLCGFLSAVRPEQKAGRAAVEEMPKQDTRYAIVKGTPAARKRPPVSSKT